MSFVGINPALSKIFPYLSRTAFSDIPKTFLAFFLMMLAALMLTVASGGNTASAQGEPAAPAGDRYGAIADILENDEARARLIQDLRTLDERGGQAAGTADGVPSPEESAAAPSGQTADELSLPRQIAQYTQSLAEGAVSEVVSLYQGAASLDRGQIGAGFTGLIPAIVDLAVVVVAVLAVFWLVRWAISPVFARASNWVLRDQGVYQLPKRVAAIVGSALIDGMAILLAWVAGYAIALFAFGEAGAMDTRQSLFLNAFLLVEAFKLILRVLFSSRYDGLRLLPVAADDAEYWNTWLARVSGLIGYGLLVAVPIVNFNISPVAGRLVALAVMLLAFLYALRAILRRRTHVRDGIHARAATASLSVTRSLLLIVGNLWHLVAIAYFAGLAIVTLFRPEDALPFMAAATAQTVAAVGGGVILSMLVTKVIVNGVRVPQETRRRLPMLEPRLNAFIPTALKAVRFLIVVVVIAFVIDAWGLFDAAAWMASELGVRTVSTLTAVASILIASALIWITIASWIEHRLSPETGKGEPGARERTLLTIFRNAFAVVLITMTSMIALSEIGIDIGPLIAGAGVLGLAIGFGAQSLVQDIITGVFIQLENAMNAGDVVTVGGITGTVERLTIRSVGMRDLSGTYHVIPFSSVSTVSNYMREFGYHVGEYGIAYRENTDDAIVHLRNAFDELMTDTDHAANIIGELEVHGVTGLADSAVNLRVRIKTIAGTQWGVGRAYNRLVKRHFDAAGIEIPYPHMTLYFGEGKDGTAPAAPVRLLQPDNGQPLAAAESAPGYGGIRAVGGSLAPGNDARTNPVSKGDFDDDDR